MITSSEALTNLPASRSISETIRTPYRIPVRKGNSRIGFKPVQRSIGNEQCSIIGGDLRLLAGDRVLRGLDRLEAYPTLEPLPDGFVSRRLFLTSPPPQVHPRLVLDPDLPADRVLHKYPVRRFDDLFVARMTDIRNIR